MITVRTPIKVHAAAVRDDATLVRAPAVTWRLEKAGVKGAGARTRRPTPPPPRPFCSSRGAFRQPADARDRLTDELIAETNKFDAATIAAEAKADKVK